MIDLLLWPLALFRLLFPGDRVITDTVLPTVLVIGMGIGTVIGVGWSTVKWHQNGGSGRTPHPVTGAALGSLGGAIVGITFAHILVVAWFGSPLTAAYVLFWRWSKRRFAPRPVDPVLVEAEREVEKLCASS